MQNREIQETPLYSLKLYNFFLYGAMVIFSSFFPLYLQEIGMDKLEIGSLMAIGPFVSVFANPFWGYTSDRSRNLRRILLFMITGTLLLLQALFHVHTYVMIYVSMIGFYFFQSPLFAQSNSLILSYIEGTDRKFGSFRIWGSFGWAVTAAVAGLIIDQTGISSISTIFTVLLLAALICTLAIPPLKSSVETATIHLRGFGSILMNGYFISFILLGILVSIPNSINSAFMSLYITELGGSKLMLGFAVFMSSIFEIIVFLLFDRFLKKKMTVMVGCLALVSLLFALRWELMALYHGPDSDRIHSGTSLRHLRWIFLCRHPVDRPVHTDSLPLIRAGRIYVDVEWDIWHCSRLCRRLAVPEFRWRNDVQCRCLLCLARLYRIRHHVVYAVQERLQALSCRRPQTSRRSPLTTPEEYNTLFFSCLPLTDRDV